jgi:general secretion pathway protein E
LRLLEKDSQRLNLAALGMAPDTQAQFDKLISRPHGIVLVTGPTGSGKTTTLYASMARLETATANIMTVEDPIEYDLPGVGQTQVNDRIGMNFARALRSILRQDPDIIMIGEMRDGETAQIAVQASLTGHLVLATLHTNDAASAVTRLTDMGVEPYLLASSLLGVLAQRLVRRLCKACRVEREGRWHPVGCGQCGGSGYQGRHGVYELLLVDEAMRALIHRQAADAELRAAANALGMRTLRVDAERWLASGLTSLEEVIRVTGGD